MHTNLDIVLKRTLIVGAGGHGKVVLDALRFSKSFLDIHVCFVDDNPQFHGLSVLGVEVFGSNDSIESDDEYHVAIGNNLLREQVTGLIESEKLITVIHPRSVISPFCKIGKGVFVGAGAILGPDALLGNGVIVNHGAIVDHDCSVGDYSHIAPAATLAGRVILGSRVLVGAGAHILPGINIGSDCVIGAGAVVCKDVPAGKTVKGIPAK